MSARLIKRFGREITLRTTIGAGSYVDGYFVPTTTIDSPIIASVQRLSAKELLLLKEGDRQKSTFKLYSMYEFKVQKDTDMLQSDYVIIDGETYMVVAVEDFFINQAMNLKYYRANVVSVNPNPS